MQARRVQILRPHHGACLQADRPSADVRGAPHALLLLRQCMQMQRWLLAWERRRRVFVLGPSHHHYTRRCCLSPASSYGTPLGKGLHAPFGAMRCRCTSPLATLMHGSWPPTSLPALSAGDIPIDAAVYEELRATGEFNSMDMSTDEVRFRLPHLLFHLLPPSEYDSLQCKRRGCVPAGRA